MLAAVVLCRQNALIDDLVNSHDEETRDTADHAENGGKVRLAVNLSTAANILLFIMQLYAAVSTGSLALFATAADAFVCSSEFSNSVHQLIICARWMSCRR
jgi:hypothetical protein